MSMFLAFRVHEQQTSNGQAPIRKIPQVQPTRIRINGNNAGEDEDDGAKVQTVSMLVNVMTMQKMVMPSPSPWQLSSFIFRVILSIVPMIIINIAAVATIVIVIFFYLIILIATSVTAALGQWKALARTNKRVGCRPEHVRMHAKAESLR